MATVRVYRHEGHPETASQYSEGWVEEEWDQDDVDGIVAALEETGRRVASEWGETEDLSGHFISWDVVEEDRGATLEVAASCPLEWHDDQDCGCREHVVSVELKGE